MPTQATQPHPNQPLQDASQLASTSNTRAWIILTLLTLALALAAFFRLYVGSSSIGFPDTSTPETQALANYIMGTRLTRLYIGLIIGAALAVSGVALQALLRNPLAEPYILGLSTGAGLGLFLTLFIVNYTTFIASTPLLHELSGALINSLGALAGASVSMLIVYLASRRRGIIDPLGLLLTGVVLSTINGALIMLANYINGPAGLRADIAQWMMGNINSAVTTPLLLTAATVTILGFALLLIFARHMDIATLSDIEAQSLGVNLRTLRIILFFVSSVLAACAVTLAGPIAFVGLICPHIVRMLLGPKHLTLLIGSAITGAALIIAADTFSAYLKIQVEISLGYNMGLLPIGIFTALLGGPVFLYILHPKLGRTDI